MKKTGALIIPLSTILAISTLASTANAKTISFNSGYGFPNFQPGPINKQYNWKSNDSLENKGWEIIMKKPPEDSSAKERKVLTFKLEEPRKFTLENNYATFHFHAQNQIKSFTIGGEYLIRKNGYLEILVSGDNENWEIFQEFNPRGKDIY